MFQRFYNDKTKFCQDEIENKFEHTEKLKELKNLLTS